MIDWMLPFVVSSGIVALLSAGLTAQFFIAYLRGIGLTVIDRHKEKLPLVPISGGLLVLFGFLMGIMTFVFLRTFIPSGNISFSFELLFAAVISIMLVTLVGFIDDLMIKRNKDSAIGLNQWQKPLLTVFAAIPLMAVKAGQTEMIIPLLGRVEFGILYPLLVIPVGFIGASNMVNILGGLNGLEAGLGILYLSSLGLFAYVNERYVAALICLMVALPLLIFLFYNKFPAKILPGNSLTYLLGGTLAAVAVVGNIEKAALIAATPFFIEFLLKVRGRLKKATVGYSKDSKIFSQHQRIYSLPHFFMNGKFTEVQVVLFVLMIEAFFIVLLWVV